MTITELGAGYWRVEPAFGDAFTMLVPDDALANRSTLYATETPLRFIAAEHLLRMGADPDTLDADVHDTLLAVWGSFEPLRPVSE